MEHSVVVVVVSAFSTSEEKGAANGGEKTSKGNEERAGIVSHFRGGLYRFA